MSYQNYTLDIISHHPQFKGKNLRKYHVKGIDTVGAWGDEPFEIVFKNNTYQKIQVKLSVDGTDILTGQPADTNVSKDMWVVNGYAELRLKAWPENNNGGAGFVFTSATNSVALHVHGDMSSRGIIAAAVFTEGHVEPIKYNPYPYYIGGSIVGSAGSLTQPTWTVFNNSTSINGCFGGDNTTLQSQNSTYSCSLGDAGQNSATYETLCCDQIGEAAPAASDARIGGSRRREKKSLEKLVAVGAGSYTEQKISYVSGLIKPVYSEAVRVKYMWWDDLVAALRECNHPTSQPDGFPGDHGKHNHINLGRTPRMSTHGNFSRGSFRRAYEPVYERI